MDGINGDNDTLIKQWDIKQFVQMKKTTGYFRVK